MATDDRSYYLLCENKIQRSYIVLPCLQATRFAEYVHLNFATLILKAHIIKSSYTNNFKKVMQHTC